MLVFVNPQLARFFGTGKYCPEATSSTRPRGLPLQKLASMLKNLRWSFDYFQTLDAKDGDEVAPIAPLREN